MMNDTHVIADVDPSREPIVLVALDDPERNPKLFACRTCGNAYSVKQVGIPNARDMAINCADCRPKTYACDMCGCETPRYRTRCDSCQHEVKLAAATEVADDGGPYCTFGGDTYYFHMDEAADAGVEWVSPCTVSYPQINADSVLETLLDDMFEDASIDDMEGVEAFYAAVKAFNDAQTRPTYFGDDKRKIRVPRDTHGSPEGRDAQRLDGEAATAGAEGIAQPSGSEQSA